MKGMAESSIHACVTDPPYHLTAGKKGGSGPASVNLASPHGRARVTTGFMGMTWDGGDVAMRSETWAEVLRVLTPGAHLLAFGGTRTFHRMMCAIEDAGFEIRDTIMWVYGSGFPKSRNLGGEWDGWGTALKPAWEPIIVARKPLEGTVAANVAKYGTGALNIDGCRIEFKGEADEREAKEKNQHGEFGSGPMTNQVFGKFSKDRENYDPPGRWPANVAHDGSDEVARLFPETTSGAMKRDVGAYDGDSATEFLRGRSGPSNQRADSGNAARFFYCAKADRHDRNEGCEELPARDLNWSSGKQSPGTFQSENTDRSATNFHPTVKPTDLMRWLCRLVTPRGGTVLDPFMGSGSTLKAAELEGFSGVGIEIAPEYAEIARRRIGADAPLFRAAGGL